MKNLSALPREHEVIKSIIIYRDFHLLKRSLEIELQHNLKLLKAAAKVAFDSYRGSYKSRSAEFLGFLKALKEAPGSQVENLRGSDRLTEKYDLIEQLFTCKEEIYQKKNEVIQEFHKRLLSLDENRVIQQNLNDEYKVIIADQEVAFKDVDLEMKKKYKSKLLDAPQVAMSKENAIDLQSHQDYFDNIKQVCAYIELEDGRILTDNDYQEVLSCLKSCKFTFHPAKNARTTSHKMTFLEMISCCLNGIKLSEDIKNKEELIKSFQNNLKEFVKTAGDEMLEKLKIPKFTKLLLEQEYQDMFQELCASYTLDNMSIYEISSLYSIGDYFAISNGPYKYMHNMLSEHIGKCILDAREMDAREKPVSKSAVIIIANNVPSSASFFQRQYDSFKEEKLFDAYILFGSGDLNFKRYEAVYQLKKMAANLKDFDKIIMQIWSHNGINDPGLAIYIAGLQEVLHDSAATIIAEIYCCNSKLYQGLNLINCKNFFIITTSLKDFYASNYDLCDYIDCLKNGSGPVDYFASKYAESGSAMISGFDIPPSTFDDYLGNIAMSINWFI